MIPEPVTVGELTLRPWDPDEAGVYVDLRDDLVLRFTTEPPDLDEKQCRTNIEEARNDPNHVPFAICGRDGTVLGNLSITRLGDTAMISYWLAPQGRGKGVATDALRAATNWAFDHLPVAEAELEIDPENIASLRVAEAAGYSRRGIRLASSCGGPAVILRRPAVPEAETSG